MQLRRALIITALLSCVVSAQVRQTLGFPVISAAAGTQAQSSAASGGFSATWLALGFVPPAACTVNAIKVRVSAATASIGANDLTLDIYSDSSGVPGSSLQQTQTVTAVPTGAAWVEFTGLTQALTALTQYWFVLRNANATPTSIFPTYTYFVPGLVPNVSSGGFTGPFVKVSTNSGGAWTSGINSTPLYRIQCSNGNYYGYPYTAAPFATNISNEQIFSGQQFGALFTTPANAGLNVSVANFYLTKVGTPTGNLSVKVYSSSATVCTSDTVLAPASLDTTVRWVGFYFSTPCALAANTQYRAVLVESTQSDTTSNSFKPSVVSVENDANSLPLTAFNGTLRGTYCASSCVAGSTWTTSFNLPVFGLQLTSGNEFNSTGGSGGQKGYAWVQ